MCRISSWRDAYSQIKNHSFLLILFLITGFGILPANGQKRYDVLITECLPDPAPAVGLPGSSFVEITNRSAFDYNLRNWKISNGISSATIKTDFLLKADSILILCPSNSTTEYRPFGSVIGITGFPSLANDAGDIFLLDDMGAVIHAIHYNLSWFDNLIKSAGGWSLEMIDPGNPTGGKENWTASIDSRGGTPGMKNSTDASNPDIQPPSLIRAITKDSSHLVLIFDEAMDSLSASVISNYELSDGIASPVAAATLPPFFDHVEISLQQPLVKGKIYSVQADIRDVSLNEMSLNNSCPAGIPGEMKSGDIIFNEILFNPPANGFDYVELYNPGSKIISAKGLFLAGRSSDGSMRDPVSLVNDDRNLFPGEYVLLTKNPGWIQHNYPFCDSRCLIEVSALPSMPDDEGKLVLLNTAGDILDELDYDHHWHSPLLINESGVSLERIRSDLPTSLSANWTSASADAGYGTPGYKNSESFNDSIPGIIDFISAEPLIFSPDLDGYHDFCFIHYQLPDAGFTGSICIYDISGNRVRTLINNLLWGTSGSFRWDGLDDQQNPLPVGHYIIYAEIFRVEGIVKKQKLVCVLARQNR